MSDDAEEVKLATAQHYDYNSDIPKEIFKYWQQRYSIFSKYDDGVLFTHDAWFGVTPEPVAERVATHLAEAAPAHKTVLVDAFAGAGGNTIQFALSGRWERIFAIERDPETLKCAKRNAEIYGVANKIWWISGDCFEVILQRFKNNDGDVVIFASPPWGGPSYTGKEVYDLSQMQPYNLDAIMAGFTKITKDVVLYLPRNSNLNQLAKYSKEGVEMPIIHYCMKGASKALVAYIGEFSHPTMPS